MRVDDCLFCKIIAEDIPAERLYEDDKCIVISDIDPQAPTHVLLLPKDHFSSLAAAEGSHRDVLGHLLLTAARFAKDKGFSDNGYRVVINTNSDGGQTVFHLHVHLLAGRPFIFPPG